MDLQWIGTTAFSAGALLFAFLGYRLQRRQLALWAVEIVSARQSFEMHNVAVTNIGAHGAQGVQLELLPESRFKGERSEPEDVAVGATVTKAYRGGIPPHRVRVTWTTRLGRRKEWESRI